MINRLLVVLWLVCSFASAARADVSPEKRSEIEKMLRLTGVEKLAMQVMDQILDSEKEGHPELPPEFWTKLHDRFHDKQGFKDLLEKIIPVYDKYYSLDDLKAVNAFYESPAGRKVLANTPKTVKECAEIGREWGKKIGEEVGAEVEAGTKK